MSKATEAKARAKDRAALMNGLRFAAGLLAIHPELSVPREIEVHRDSYYPKDSSFHMCVKFALPNSVDEQACLAMLAVWETVLGPFEFRNPYDGDGGRQARFGRARSGDIVVEITAFYDPPVAPAVDVDPAPDPAPSGEIATAQQDPVDRAEQYAADTRAMAESLVARTAVALGDAASGE
jgi:hypothetical protein